MPPPEIRGAQAPARRCSGRLPWSMGLGTALFIARYLEKRPGGAVVAIAKLAVAAVDLPLAGKIRAEDLKLEDWPADHLPAGAIRDPKELVGRILISRVLAGQPILPGMLAAKNAGNGLAALIPPNMRAMAVRVDDVVGVAGFIHPDDRVDVLVTLHAAAPGRRDDQQGVLAEREGAGRRPGGRGQRPGAHAREPGDGGHAAGVAAGRRTAGAGLGGRAAAADVAQLDRLAGGQHRRRRRRRAGRRARPAARRRQARAGAAGAARRRHAAGVGGVSPPRPPCCPARAHPRRTSSRSCVATGSKSASSAKETTARDTPPRGTGAGRLR